MNDELENILKVAVVTPSQHLHEGTEEKSKK
jgi:hypothetical protein